MNEHGNSKITQSNPWGSVLSNGISPCPSTAKRKKSDKSISLSLSHGIRSVKLLTVSEDCVAPPVHLNVTILRELKGEEDN